MYNDKGFDKIIDSFLDDLPAQGISLKSITNYKSDLNSFENWLRRKLNLLGVFTDNLSDSIAFITPEIGPEYKKYLLDSNTVSSTLNRRLSTLRRLSKFLLDKGLLEFDFMREVNNIKNSYEPKLDLESLTSEFRLFLESEKVTKNTVKNYVSDIKHFINWFNSSTSGELND